MFGFDSYEVMIKMIRDEGFKFKKFLDGTDTKAVYLRHDVDFSVHKARELAEFESKIGVVSTYFFMLSSNTYNALSLESIANIKDIKDMGHEISLHFDPLVYGDLDWGFSFERDIFQSVFDVELNIVSIHRPGEFLSNNNRTLENCRHTYEDEFFSDMDYLSDSGGRDVRVKMMNLLEKSSSSSIHLLTHPIWWVSKLKTPTATIEQWLEKNSLFMREEARRNCKTFKG